MEQKHMLEEQQTTLGVLSSMQAAAKAQKKTMQARAASAAAAGRSSVEYWGRRGWQRRRRSRSGFGALLFGSGRAWVGKGSSVPSGRFPPLPPSQRAAALAAWGAVRAVVTCAPRYFHQATCTPSLPLLPRHSHNAAAGIGSTLHHRHSHQYHHYPPLNTPPPLDDVTANRR
jgi:hypothetical protein